MPQVNNEASEDEVIPAATFKPFKPAGEFKNDEAEDEEAEYEEVAESESAEYEVFTPQVEEEEADNEEAEFPAPVGRPFSRSPLDFVKLEQDWTKAIIHHRLWPWSWSMANCHGQRRWCIAACFPQDVDKVLGYTGRAASSGGVIPKPSGGSGAASSSSASGLRGLPSAESGVVPPWRRRGPVAWRSAVYGPGDPDI